MHKRLALTLIAAALMAAFMTTTASTAEADRSVFYTDGGYRCELNTENTLAKGVCRNPRNFGDFFVMYFDTDWGTGTVFVDSFRPLRPGMFEINQEQISVYEFYRRTGRY